MGFLYGARMNKRLFFFLMVFLFASQAFAVSIKQAQLHSYLGEPLKVSVPLVLADSEVHGDVRVMLASVQEYQILEQALPKSYALLRVDVEKRTPQAWNISLTSSEAIDESYLVIVLKVQRGRGNFFKKIQLFIDPAFGRPSEGQATISKPEISRIRSPENFPNKESKLRQQAYRESTNSPRIKLPKGWARRDSYGPVQRGDSLSEIAYRLRKDKRWSNREIMLALYQKNKNAFANQDINHLKKGSFLQVPDDMEVRVFVDSPQYKALNGKFFARSKRTSVKPKQEATAKLVKSPAQGNIKRYKGRIALGLSENLDAPIVNAMVLSKLEKSNRLYKRLLHLHLA